MRRCSRCWTCWRLNFIARSADYRESGKAFTAHVTFWHAVLVYGVTSLRAAGRRLAGHSGKLFLDKTGLAVCCWTRCCWLLLDPMLLFHTMG